MRKRAPILVALAVLLGSASALSWFGLSVPPPLDPALLNYSRPRTTLLAVGDILLARQIGVQMAASGDFALPFRHLAADLRSADIAFANLEGLFCAKPPYTRRGIVFRVDPRAVEGLRHAGLDVVSVANNHTYDGGPRCLEYSLGHLKTNGILPAGAGKSAEEAHAARILTRNRVRFAFLAYTYAARNEGLNLPRSRWVSEVAHRDLPQMQRDVARAREQADVVIVSLHDGAEYTRRPGFLTRRFARAAIAAGAAVVLGHHPHVAQPVERYFDPESGRDGWVFYSLGNFIFWQNRPHTREAIMARLTFDGARLERVEALPVVIEEFATPRLATPKEAPAILSSAGADGPLLWPAPVRSPRPRSKQ